MTLHNGEQGISSYITSGAEPALDQYFTEGEEYKCLVHEDLGRHNSRNPGFVIEG